MRRFAIIGSTALASDEFLLDDLPGTSGRLDVLVRCVRAALLHSHGMRRDAVVYLVLLGGPRAPRTLRVSGATAKFVRPDERALATLIKKTLAVDVDKNGFVEVRPGISVANGGVEAVLADARGATRYVLDESGEDVRGVELASDAIFFVGDHVGLDATAVGDAMKIAIGPVSVHSDDVVAIVSNEIDRAATTSRRR